jgi:hypothetical protein
VYAKYTRECPPKIELHISWTLKLIERGPTLRHLYPSFAMQLVTNDKMWTSIHRNPLLN